MSVFTVDARYNMNPPNIEFLLWIFGAVCGGIGSAVFFAFHLGGIVAQNRAAMQTLSNATARLNELINGIQTEHREHKRDIYKEVFGLGKTLDLIKERVSILENENAHLRETLREAKTGKG